VNTLFDVGPDEPPEKLSYGRRLTIRNNAALADNRHPLMGGPLNTDESCGTCVHHVARAMGHVYHKCRLRETGGPATDIRVGWPACTKWSPL